MNICDFFVPLMLYGAHFSGVSHFLIFPIRVGEKKYFGL